VVGMNPAHGDGQTDVEYFCPGQTKSVLGQTFEIPDIEIPIPIEANDDADPVEPGSTVVNTFSIPLDLEAIGGDDLDLSSLPITPKLKRTRITFAIPEGVTVTGFTGSTGDFAGTYAVSGGNL